MITKFARLKKCNDIISDVCCYTQLSSPSPKSQSPKSHSQDQKDLGWHNNHMGHHPTHPTHPGVPVLRVSPYVRSSFRPF